MLELDQSTSDRQYAIQNLVLLEDPEIVSYIEKQPIDIQKGYYQLLGFTELHVAQITLFENGEDIQKPLEYLHKSLEHEYMANAFPENIAYKKATIAYLENNTELLEELIQKNISGNNLKIVTTMLQGLRERGYPDYKKDYFGM